MVWLLSFRSCKGVSAEAIARAAQVENCEPIKGKMTDHEVTWKGKSLGAAHKNGAVSLELKIPSDATAFAVSI